MSKTPKIEISTGLIWIALVVWIVMCVGDPDIIDGIVHRLMNP